MFRNIMAVLGCAAFALGCAHDRVTGQDPREPVRPLTAVETRVASSSVAFGLDLLREVHAAEAQPNVLLSPLSASMALGMALTGARGETFDAMRGVLGFAGLDDAAINEAYRGLLAQLRARGPDVEIGVANGAWHERTFHVLPDYLARVRQHFNAEVAGIDFRDPASPDVINAWVRQQTGGRISELIDRIGPLDRLILVNAVYFRAGWARTFEPDATRPDAFTTADGRTIQVPTMMQDAQYRWFRDDDAFGVELFYTDSAFSMVLVAPADGRSLDQLVAQLTPQQWEGWLAGMQTGRIMLRMPKFRFEYGVPLKDPLTALGMGIAFQPYVADFQRMAPVDDLHISRVQQNTFIDVHELGTEAAAATAVVMSVTSMPPVLHFDRPFIAAIRERESGTLLFLGRVGEPAY